MTTESMAGPRFFDKYSKTQIVSGAVLGLETATVLTGSIGLTLGFMLNNAATHNFFNHAGSGAFVNNLGNSTAWQAGSAVIGSAALIAIAAIAIYYMVRKENTKFDLSLQETQEIKETQETKTHCAAILAVNSGDTQKFITTLGSTRPSQATSEQLSAAERCLAEALRTPTNITLTPEEWIECARIVIAQYAKSLDSGKELDKNAKVLLCSIFQKIEEACNSSVLGLSPVSSGESRIILQQCVNQDLSNILLIASKLQFDRVTEQTNQTAFNGFIERFTDRMSELYSGLRHKIVPLKSFNDPILWYNALSLYVSCSKEKDKNPSAFASVARLLARPKLRLTRFERDPSAAQQILDYVTEGSRKNTTDENYIKLIRLTESQDFLDTPLGSEFNELKLKSTSGLRVESL